MMKSGVGTEVQNDGGGVRLRGVVLKQEGRVVSPNVKGSLRRVELFLEI